MGKHYPPLDQDQVETVLKALNFSPKNTVGSHTQWEGYTNGIRRIVTVAHLGSRKEKYSHDLLKKMIQQSGLSKNEFYSYLGL